MSPVVSVTDRLRKESTIRGDQVVELPNWQFAFETSGRLPKTVEELECRLLNELLHLYMVARFDLPSMADISRWHANIVADFISDEAKTTRAAIKVIWNELHV